MAQIIRYRSKTLDVAHSNVKIALLPVGAIPSYEQASLSDTVTIGSGADAKDYIFAIQYRYGFTEWVDADNYVRQFPAATITLQLTRGVAAWLIARMFQHLPGQHSNMQNLRDTLSRDDVRSAINGGAVSIAGANMIKGTMDLDANENVNTPKYVGLVEISNGVNQIGFLVDNAVEHYYEHYDVASGARSDAEADGLNLSNLQVMQSFADWADAFAARTAYFTKYFPVNVKDFSLAISQPYTGQSNLFANAGYVFTAKAILPNGETQEQSIDPRMALMRIFDAFGRPYAALAAGVYTPHNDSQFFWDSANLRGYRVGFVDAGTIMYATLPTDFAAESDYAFTSFANARQSYFQEAGAGNEFKPVEYCYSDAEQVGFSKNSPLGQALTLLAPQHADIWAQFVTACEVTFEAWWRSETRAGGSAADLTPVLDAISSQTTHLDGETSSQTTTVMNALAGMSTSLQGAIATAETSVNGHVTESTATLIAAISAIDFDQTPTMGLANLIQSQNRVTQALVLALLRKSSSRAWFTSLIDKIGDANALLIDDTEIASIAEKAYQGDAVSNDEIHATPREAYKELFNDRGVKNG